MPKVCPVILANEARAAFMRSDAAYDDRKLFVYNLGILLSQTREGIVGAELDDQDIVSVIYKGGHKVQINVAADSYLAIIRDVTKNL